jgi:enoyl-CoA hydratase/carnithine racemase
MAEPLVLYEKRGGAAWLTLNRAEALNAINLEMRDQLWEILHAVRDDPDVGVAVITGAGDSAFSAGADVKEFGTAPSYLQARDARRERDLWGFMLSLNKPLIAAIHGYAYGAGCEMSLCCDLRLASDDAQFALPEVSLGYIPSAGGTQLLPRSIPVASAMAMILTGGSIDAAEALRLGLVHRVVAREDLESEAEALANELLARPAHALRLAKRALAVAMETALVSGLNAEAGLAALALAGSHRG